MKSNKKAGISTQVVFFILMALFMVAIIIFGLQRLFEVDNLLSEDEKLDLEKQIKEDFAFCENPLNKGAFKKIKFEDNAFNVICVRAKDDSFDPANSRIGVLALDLEQLYTTGDSVTLIQASFTIQEEGKKRIARYSIVESFSSEVPFKTSQCFFDEGENSQVVIDLTC